MVFFNTFINGFLSLNRLPVCLGTRYGRAKSITCVNDLGNMSCYCINIQPKTIVYRWTLVGIRFALTTTKSIKSFCQPQNLLPSTKRAVDVDTTAINFQQKTLKTFFFSLYRFDKANSHGSKNSEPPGFF